MSELSVEQYDEYIDKLKEEAELGDVFERLFKNPDFDRIINKEYMQNEAIRLVNLKADPAMQTEERQKDIDNRILGIGALQQFIIQLNKATAMAKRSISEAEGERQRFLNGDFDDQGEV